MKQITSGLGVATAGSLWMPRWGCFAVEYKLKFEKEQDWFTWFTDAVL